MIKPLIILFNTVSVFLFTFFFGDSPVTVNGNFPKSANIGTEFVAEIIINKSNVNGFAKLQLEVPQGFIVKELDSKSGNFSFTNNVAKIIWTAIPTDAQLIVKFTVAAESGPVGTKTIGAKFSYVNSSNTKEVFDMAPAEIQITDGAFTPIAATEAPDTTTPAEEPTTTPVASEPATTSTPPSTGFSNPTDPLSSVVCSRTITKLSATEYNVEVKIKKPGIKGFAKFQEILPAGYNAKGDKTSGSSFSVSDGKAKFVWVSLPTDDELLLTYVLQKETSDNNEVKLEGEFSYLENDQTKKTKVPTDVITPTGDVIAATTTTPDNSTASTPQARTTETPVATETPATTPTETLAVTTDLKTPEPTPTTSNTTLAKKEGNVAYAVQVGAFRNAIESTVLSKKFNISETIKSEMAEGFSKFMVGSFNQYKEARTHREEIKQKGCNSAFVVAYNGAKRITVQEALMITSQKWYK